MKSTYSFGVDSPLKFQISDKLAKNYNEAVVQFLKAQQRFNQKFGRRWDPIKDPIELRWTSKQQKAWNDFAKVFNEVVKDQGPIHVNDILDDYLVKDVALQEAQRLMGNGGSYITTAVTLGALYGLLRGLNDPS
jgi:hypothetical protein